jgi:hypothetical protein
MEDYIILVTKIDTDERYIYNLDTSNENNKENNLEKIMSYLHLSNPYLKYDTESGSVYECVNTIKKGWIWNSIIDKKDIKYKLEFIKVLNMLPAKDDTKEDTNTKEDDTIIVNTEKESWIENQNDIVERWIEKRKEEPKYLPNPNNCFNLELLSIELKEILNKPNYGLKKMKTD